MIKKKLSRIEDFISPTCFSYPANTFKDSYKVPFTPTLYKTSYGNSFYFLYSIIRTKICFLREAKLCNTLKKTKKFSKKHFVSSAKIYRLPIKLVHRLPYLAGASLRLPRLQRGMTSEVSYARYRLLAIPRCKRGKLVLAVHPLRGCKPSVCLALLASPKVMHEFAPQTIPEGDAPHEANPQTSAEGAVSPKAISRVAMQARIFANQSRVLYAPHLTGEGSTCEGSLSTFRKIRPQKITTIFFDSLDTTSYIIVRPLINCSRKNITIACRLNRLPVYPDLSNLKLRYSRNRIRKQIIPTLKFFLNPKIEKSLFKFSENLEQ